jgi:hypothetical protein
MATEDEIFNFIFKEKDVVDTLEPVSNINSYYLQSYFFDNFNSKFSTDSIKNEIINSYSNLKYSGLDDLANLIKNSKEDTSRIEEIPMIYSYNINPRIQILRSSYSNLVRNKNVRPLIKNARNKDDLCAIVIIDEFIKDLNKENISYNLDNSKLIKNNLIELASPYSLIPMIKNLKNDKNILYDLGSSAKQLFTKKHDLESIIGSLVNSEQEANKISNIYRNMDKKLSKNKLFLENKSLLENAIKEIAKNKNKIRKQLDEEALNIVHFFNHFDLNCSKSKINENHDKLNKIIRYYEKLSFPRKDMVNFSRQINNKKSYFFNLINNKKRLDNINGLIITDIKNLNKKSIDFDYISDFLLARTNLEKYQRQIKKISDDYKETEKYSDKLLSKVSNIVYLFNDKHKIVKKYLNEKLDYLESYAENFNIKTDAETLSDNQETLENVLRYGSNFSFSGDRLVKLDQRFDYMDGFVKRSKRLDDVKKSIDKLESIKPYFKVSFDLDYLNQLVKYNSTINRVENYIKYISEDKKLKKKVTPYIDQFEGLRLECNQYVYDIKQRFKSEVDQIKNKVDCLINSKIAINRESRLDAYEKKAKDYIKIERKLKCLS